MMHSLWTPEKTGLHIKSMFQSDEPKITRYICMTIGNEQEFKRLLVALGTWAHPDKDLLE